MEAENVTEPVPQCQNVLFYAGDGAEPFRCPNNATELLLEKPEVRVCKDCLPAAQEFLPEFQAFYKKVMEPLEQPFKVEVPPIDFTTFCREIFSDLVFGLGYRITPKSLRATLLDVNATESAINMARYSRRYRIGELLLFIASRIDPYQDETP